MLHLFHANDAGTVLVQHALLDEFTDRLAGLDSRVELDQRLRPEFPGSEAVFDKALDSIVAELNEAAVAGRIVSDELIAESKKYLHEAACL